MHSSSHSYGSMYRFGLFHRAHVYPVCTKKHAACRVYVKYFAIAFFPLFFFYFYTRSRYYFLPTKLSRGSRWRGDNDKSLPRSSSQAEEKKRKNNGPSRERNSNCDPRTIDTWYVRVGRESVSARASLIDRVDSRASDAQIILRSSVGCTFFGGSRNCRQ